jgi:hypothetical protein
MENRFGDNWCLAVFFVVGVTFVFGAFGFGFGVVANNKDYSFAYILTAFGAIVGLGLSIGLIKAIRYLSDWWRSRESNSP